MITTTTAPKAIKELLRTDHIFAVARQNNRNMTGATIGAVAAYPSGALSLTQFLVGFVLLKFVSGCKCWSDFFVFH
jgi:hypothetical protein